jgi:hypothetical protein
MKKMKYVVVECLLVFDYFWWGGGGGGGGGGGIFWVWGVGFININY